MKKPVLIILGLISMFCTYGQNMSDAVRYTTETTLGTARFNSMSGAFGALGGDLSAVGINPAGSAIFKTSYISLSASNFNTSNKAEFGSNSNPKKNNKASLDMNQLGAVFVFNNRNNNSVFNKLTASVFCEQIQNYNNEFLAAGVTSNSISSYFSEFANGLRLDEISALEDESISQAYNAIGYYNGYAHQQAFLGYESYILEPDENSAENSTYFSNIAPGEFNQEYSYSSTGYNGKLSFNLGIQYNQKLYFGINLNSHFINYERNSYLFENNVNPNSYINQVDFENSLLTTGNGFSLQIGSLYKINNFLRLGMAYDSPTWLTLREETTQYLATFDNTENIRTTINPAVVNVFPEYKIKTPAKITGSAAFIFSDKGLLSVDFSRKDYTSTRLSSNSSYGYSQENNEIVSSLKVANSLRIGAEIRYKKISYRGGYRLEESPYKNNVEFGDLRGFSLGLGFNLAKSRLDISYQNSSREIEQQLYQAGNLGSTKLNTNNSNISVTLSMNL
jgi:hypothetical protein